MTQTMMMGRRNWPFGQRELLNRDVTANNDVAFDLVLEAVALLFHGLSFSQSLQR